MFGPAAFLRGCDTLAGRFAENAFFARLGTGRWQGCVRSVLSAASKLAANVIDLGLNFLALLLEMTQGVLKYSSVLIRFTSSHEIPPAHYIMEKT
jgi:hypothetical protein